MKNFEFIVDFPNEEKGLDLDLTIEDCNGLDEDDSLTVLKDLVMRDKIERGGGFRSMGTVVIGWRNFLLEYSVCDELTDDEDSDDVWRDVVSVVPM